MISDSTRSMFRFPSGDPNRCPVQPLGLRGGRYRIRDAAGHEHLLTGGQLHDRADLLALFGGDDAWLRARFPLLDRPARPGRWRAAWRWLFAFPVVVDFDPVAAAEWLAAGCLGLPVPLPARAA